MSNSCMERIFKKKCSEMLVTLHLIKKNQKDLSTKRFLSIDELKTALFRDFIHENICVVISETS